MPPILKQKTPPPSPSSQTLNQIPKRKSISFHNKEDVCVVDLEERDRSPTFSKKHGSFSSELKPLPIEKPKQRNSMKPILKSGSMFLPKITEISYDPFKINLLEVLREKPHKRSSSLLASAEVKEINDPQTNLIEFFKNQSFSRIFHRESEVDLNLKWSSEWSSIYSYSSSNSPAKQQKKSATFSINLKPTFKEEKKNGPKKKISNILGNIPKAKFSLSLHRYDRYNQYILIKPSER